MATVMRFAIVVPSVQTNAQWIYKMDEPFWKTVLKEQRVQFVAVVVVLSCTIINGIFVEDEIIKAIVRMILVLALGVQWIDITRDMKRRQIRGMEFDKEQLERFKEPSMTGFMSLKFLVPYKYKRFSYPLQRLLNRTVLSLYTYGSDNNGSYTKICATEKDMFELKLKGYVETEEVEYALEGVKYLTTRKRKLVT